MQPPSNLAQAAQTGFAASSAYDAHRPSYSPEALSELLDHLEVAGVQGARIVDLAAGTGKFTEVLAARPENFEIIAVEPHDEMRQELERKKLNRVRVYKGMADSMPEVEDGSAAALVAAQSFHWFANMEALKEIYRVLQPAGVFGMIWNIDDYNAPLSWEITPGWETKVRDLTWTFDDDMPRFRHEKWRQVFDEQSPKNPFKLTTTMVMFGLPLGERSIKFETWLPKEDVWKRYRTISHIAILEGSKLERVQKTFWDAIDAKDTRTDEQGRVAVHGHTFFAWTSKIPAEPLRSEE